MVAALDALTDVPPSADREAVREEYLRRVIPEFTGHQVDTVTWSTTHGDLHYGNVTRRPHILDWEGWGRAPYGYDAVTLYVYALLTPRRPPASGPSWPLSWTGPRLAPAC
ncbi:MULTISPECIES: phosphotransferase [unclassified Streptomyces]|uniref:phosphotransferase n=1 Tax=unclassified Streptomyces TaxID=2593676 RepID=UPI003328B8DD